MKFNEIVKLAEQVKKNVEQKKTASINKTQNYSTLAYLFSKSILNIGKSVGIKKVPQNPKPQTAEINGGIGIKNCQKLCQLMVNWVDKHGEAPAYLKFNNKKISIWVWTYATAEIILYYNKNGKLPQKQLVTSKPFRKPTPPKPTVKCSSPYYSKGHSTEHCCDDMGQNTPYYCACHSLQEVLRKLTGKVIRQSTLASVMGTTSDGTGHDGIETAIYWFNRNYGYNISMEEKSFKDLGWTGVGKLLCQPNVDIIFHNLYRNQYGHYEVINMVDTDEHILYVQNSLGDRCSSGCYYGYVEERSFSEMESYMSGISQKSCLVFTKK